jgi:hypothetical protein
MRRVNWQAGKMLVPLLGVFTALAVGVAVVAIVLQVQERDKRLARERELQQVLLEKDELEARLQEVEQIKARIEQNLERTRADLAKSAEELAAAIEAQTKLTQAVEDREAEITRLTGDLTQARQDAQGIAGQLSTLQADREAMRQQVADLEQAKGELESKVMELSGDRPMVELGKVVVSGQPGSMGPTSVLGGASKVTSDGQVVVVNREYDFIVMNLGRNHGLAIGQEFQIVRNDEVLGLVKVEKVYDELSAATIVQESQPDTIREGDLVRAL